MSKAAQSVPLTPAHCEVLFELFNGGSGSVQLGRLLKGPDSGRLVALRTLHGEPSPELASAVDVARSIAHPKLVKVLGVIANRDSWFVASELIVGVTLFELVQHVSRRGIPLGFRVATRVILDALAAASEAERLLLATAKLQGVRTVFPESLWIADYGEVFVAEPLLAPLFHGDARAADDARASAAMSDVLAAAEALRELLSGGSEPAESDVETVPPELERIVADALGGDGVSRFESIDEFAAALAGLGEELIASEDEVGLEMRRLMGALSERRRQRLEMLERDALEAVKTEPDATRVFRVAATQLPAESVRPFEDATVVFRSVVPRSAPPRSIFPRRSAPRSIPTVPAQVEIQHSQQSEPPSPISVVWREARALMDAPNRRLRPAAAALEPASPSPPATAELGPMLTPRGTRIARIAAIVAFGFVVVALAMLRVYGMSRR